MANRSMLAQAWLDTRFQGLIPSDFGPDGVRIYLMSQLRLPEAFGGYWNVLDGSPTSSEHTMSGMEIDAIHAAQALLIFSDVYDEDQVKNLVEFICLIDRLGHDAPPMFLGIHTCDPSIREAEYGSWFPSFKMFKEIIDLGIDGIIEGEPCGLTLAMIVQAKIRKAVRVSQALIDAVNYRRQKVQHEQFLKQCMNAILRDYLPIRVAQSIPPLNPNLLEGLAVDIGGLKIGAWLAEGMFGSVYRLVNATNEIAAQVINLQAKRQIQELEHLKTLKRTIDISKILSPNMWTHPNVVRLYEVCHSDRNTWLRMGNAGPENLYKQLVYRQTDGLTNIPPPLDKLQSFLFDLIDVMTHLHVHYSLCHRDIKPENLIVYEMPDSITIRFADFGMSGVMQEDSRMRHSPCCTMRFTAQEVLFNSQYRGKKLDIRNMNVMVLELLCGVRLLEDALKLDAVDPKYFKSEECLEKAVARNIRAYFNSANQVPRLLTQNCRSELRT